MRLIIIILMVMCLPALATTYYVTITGDDVTGNGSIATPWRTVQKATDMSISGDIVSVAAGTYDEYVTTKASGVSFYSTNYSARVRQFRINNHTNVIVSGFQIALPSNDNYSMVRIEQNAHNFILTNCLVGPGTYVISTNLSFDSVTKTINVPDKDLNASGFIAGSRIYLGACGLDGQWYTNHDSAATVGTVAPDGHSMTVTNAIAADGGSGYWGFIYAGANNNATPGVLGVLGSGINCPSNTIIVNCIFSNVVGAGVSGSFNRALVKGNTFRDIPAYYGIFWSGRDSLIVSNLFLNNRNVLYYTQAEMNSLVHAGGGTWFDYQLGHLHGGLADSATNNTYIYNWFENIENQLGVIQHYTLGNNAGFYMRSNVFVGVAMHGSFSRNDVVIEHNTFVRCSYDINDSSPNPIVAGGNGSSSPPTGNLVQNGITIRSNAFIACGNHSTYAEGIFSIGGSVTNASLSNNFACAAETMGWKAITAPTNVYTPTNLWFLVNGGDPKLQQISNPRGPDGIPFTDDDGLRPLAGSPLATYGFGALETSTNTLAAYYDVANVITWQDVTSTNYNNTWLASLPFNRAQPERPYTTPEVLGRIPLWVTFTATNSVGDNIYWYQWDFGDGRTQTVYRSPSISHLYCSTGAFTVTLTITNNLGNFRIYTNSYTLLPRTNITQNIWLVSTNGSDSNDGTNSPFLTIAKAVTKVTAGDIVSVSAGRYPELVDVNRNVATSGSPITFVGYGATAGGWQFRYSDFVLDGFNLDGTGCIYGQVVYIYPAANRVTIIGNTISWTTNLNGVILARGANGINPSLSASSCVITNNRFLNMWGSGNFPIQIQTFGQSNYFARNVFYKGQGQADCFRVWGIGHIIADNYAQDMSDLVENHTDFVQNFGPLSPVSNTNDYDFFKDIVIERNWVRGGQISPCIFQETYNTNGIGMWTNVIFRNNIFSDLPYTAGCSADGTKWFNNLFYRTRAASAIVGGGASGSAFGTEIYNNIFYECGIDPSSTSSGWYDNRIGNINGSLTADYNFVTGTNSASKSVSPPDSDFRWASYGYEVHGINGGNPLFVDAPNGDFHISTSSPLIGTGTTLTGFNTTFDGVTRSGAWSIGPFNSPPSQSGPISSSSRIIRGVFRITGSVKL